jgi:hypothetical protein
MYSPYLWKKIALPGALMMLLGVIAFAGPEEEKSPESSPLTKSVTLYFELAGAGQSFAITTATTDYRLHSEVSRARENGQEDVDSASSDAEGGNSVSSEVATESQMDFEGSVSIDEATGLVFVTCDGTIRELKDAEDEASGTENESRFESTINFDANTRIRPGAPKLLVQSGPFSVNLTVEIAE